MQGECAKIARCSPLVWTEEERKAGLAEAWETRVLTQGK